jgi:hypothetical protein
VPPAALLAQIARLMAVQSITKPRLKRAWR